MLHSTLRKVTAIHKIKADSLKVWTKSQNVMVYKQPKTDYKQLTPVSG